VGREKLDDWCGKGILGLVLAVLVFGPLALGGVRPWQFLILEGLTLASVALWGVRLWISPRPRLLWPPICWAVLAFVAYATVRYFQADIEYAARQELIHIVVYALLFFVILNNLHGQELTQAMVLTVIFLGLGISGYGIFQFVTRSHKVWNLASTYGGRAGGTFYNPNNLAGFLEMVLPLALCYVLAGRLSVLTKVMVGYAAVVMVGGVAGTVSRGGAVVTGAELVLVCGVLLFQRNYRIQALALLSVLGAVAFFLAPKLHMVRTRFEDIKDTSHVSGDSRTRIWTSALQMWKDHEWQGVGPAHFDYCFAQYRPPELQRRPEFAHNEYLNTLADYGVIGAVLVGGAWLLLYVGVIFNWRAVRGPQDDFARKKSNRFAFMVGASLGLLGILGHSVVDFQMHVPAVAILAIALMALLASQCRFATERFWCQIGLGRKLCATCVIVLTVGGLGWIGRRAVMEDDYIRQAMRQPVYSYEQIADLKQAARIEPNNFETTYDIAESYRTKSSIGGDGYVDLARQAMEWYQRGMRLNPHDAYNWLRYGGCLDWIASQVPGQEDSQPYFDHANELDPNGMWTTLWTGMHYGAKEDYAAERTWLERSRQFEWVLNTAADRYLPIVEQRMLEAAQGMDLTRQNSFPDTNAPWKPEERIRSE
jgi:O-antigen ligase